MDRIGLVGLILVAYLNPERSRANCTFVFRDIHLHFAIYRRTMITQDFVDFFNGLEENNHKDWFHAHKNDYDTHVRGPFIALVDELIPQIITELEAFISPNAKDALFRINRDIRFTPDRPPYNTIMKASFAPGGKRSFLPGYYLGIDAHSVHVGGGLFNLKSPELKKIREHIADDPMRFAEILSDREFASRFGELKGERSKRLPREFKIFQERVPEIANKQFFAMVELPLADYLGKEGLDEVVMGYFRAVHPLNRFLKESF